jgi:hypothetical protein
MATFNFENNLPFEPQYKSSATGFGSPFDRYGSLPLPGFNAGAYEAEENRIAAIPDDVFIRENVPRRTLPDLQTLTAADREALGATAIEAGHRLAGALQLGNRNDPSHFENIDALYQAWFVNQQNTTSSETGAILSSFESFIAAFGLESTLPKGDLINKVGQFTSWVIGGRVLQVDYQDPNMPLPNSKTYTFAGNWYKVYDSGRFRKYVDQVIIDEVREKAESWPKPNQLVFHETGSAALSGIGAEKAILSARRAIERGYTPRTGEVNETPIFSGGDRDIKDRASGTVWTAFAMKGSYTTSRWFDEYPVAFGISQEGLVEHQEQQAYRTRGLFDSGEGIMAGPEIPLTLVKAVYAPSLALPRAREWVAANCLPGTPVVSQEAAEYHDLIVSKMSELQSRSPVIIT